MRRLVYRSSQILLLLMLGLVLWSGWYLSHKGLSRRWRKQLIAEVHKAGVEISFRRLTLDPLRGLVARDVRVMDPHRRALATINSVVLDINYANLLHGQPSLHSVDLREASLVLPLGQGEAQPLEVTGLSAKLFIEPDRIQLSHAHANFYGARISAKGRLVNTGSLKTARERGAGPQLSGTFSFQWLQRMAEVLMRTKGNPELTIDFSGDFSALNNIYAKAVLSARNLAHGQLQFRSLYGETIYSEGAAELRQLTVLDKRGRLEASGRFENGSLQLDLLSNLDPQALGGFFPLLNECVFYSVPDLKISVRGPWESPQLVGRIDLQKFSLRSALFEGLGAGFSWKAGDWYISDLQLSHRSGQLSASALSQAGQWRAKLESNLNPRALLPLASGTLAQLLGTYEFDQTPSVRLALQGIGSNTATLSGSGDLALGRTRIRGVPLESLNTALEFKDDQLFCQKLRITRGEGNASGALSYHFGRRELRLDKIALNLVPVDVATWIDPRLAHDLAPYRFHGAPRLSLNGKIQFAAPKETGLEVLVDSPAGMDYVFLKKNLPANAVSGRLFFTDGRLQISNLKADLFKGGLQGGADISLQKEDQRFSGRIRTERVDFESLTKLYFQYAGSGGVLNADFDFSGRGEDARLLRGSGKLEVIDGNVFSIPLFGPLSKLFDTVLPGAGYQQAHKGTASFDIKDGVLATRDFEVKGKGFAMMGDGQLHFLDDKIDFDIRMNARGAPGMVLFPVSKLFEYKGEGSLSQPAWHPKRF